MLSFLMTLFIFYYLCLDKLHDDAHVTFYASCTAFVTGFFQLIMKGIDLVILFICIAER
jgi:hypothetical protein